MSPCKYWGGGVCHDFFFPRQILACRLFCLWVTCSRLVWGLAQDWRFSTLLTPISNKKTQIRKSTLTPGWTGFQRFVRIFGVAVFFFGAWKLSVVCVFFLNIKQFEAINQTSYICEKVTAFFSTFFGSGRSLLASDEDFFGMNFRFACWTIWSAFFLRVLFLYFILFIFFFGGVGGYIWDRQVDSSCCVVNRKALSEGMPTRATSHLHKIHHANKLSAKTCRTWNPNMNFWMNDEGIKFVLESTNYIVGAQRLVVVLLFYPRHPPKVVPFQKGLLLLMGEINRKKWVILRASTGDF